VDGQRAMDRLTGGQVALTCAVLFIAATQAVAGEERAADVTRAITELFHDPADPVNGAANEYFEDKSYHHLIIVEYTGNELDSVDTQVQTSAEAALRIGHLVLDKGFRPPGEHLIIKMALKKRDSWFINTFSVRYGWADVLTMAKAHAKISELGAKGKIERIWREYWPTMCLNLPPRELFAGGDGDAEMPEDVQNPTGKDLSCHR
jgi:hypothetical protein